MTGNFRYFVRSLGTKFLRPNRARNLREIECRAKFDRKGLRMATGVPTRKPLIALDTFGVNAQNGPVSRVDE